MTNQGTQTKLEEICQKQNISPENTQQAIRRLRRNFHIYRRDHPEKSDEAKIRNLIALTKIIGDDSNIQDSIDNYFSNQNFFTKGWNETERRLNRFKKESGEKISTLAKVIGKTPSVNWILKDFELKPDWDVWYQHRPEYIQTMRELYQELDPKKVTELQETIKQETKEAYNYLFEKNRFENLQQTIKATGIEFKPTKKQVDRKYKHFFSTNNIEGAAILFETIQTKVDHTYYEKVCAKYLVDKSYRLIKECIAHEEVLGIFPKDLIHEVYQEYFKSCDVEEVIKLRNATQINPDENKLQRFYQKLVRQGRLKDVLKLEKKTKIKPRIPQGTAKQGYSNLLRDSKFEDILELKEYLCIELDETFYTAFVKEYMTNVER